MPHAIIHGIYRGVTHGVNRGVTVGRDGPSNILMPQGLAQWQTMSTYGIPVPDWHWRCQEASGSLVDDVLDAPLAASGTPSYAQVVAGWTRKFASTDSETATEGFGSAAGTLWNLNNQSVFVCFYFKPTSVSALRVLFSLAGGNAYVSINGSGRLQLRGTGGAFGTPVTDYIAQGLVVPVVVEYIPGTGVVDHSGAGLYRLSTTTEQQSVPWALESDDIKGIGGAGAFTPGVVLHGDVEVWTGTKAETLSTLGPKPFLEARGWTVTGY